jgi:hypothetical protein
MREPEVPRLFATFPEFPVLNHSGQTLVCGWVVLSCTRNAARVARPFSLHYKNQNDNLERGTRDLYENLIEGGIHDAD